MKLSLIVIGLVCITGCANTSVLQAKLEKSETKANDLQSRLELAEGSIQELQAEASRNDDLCKKAMARLHQFETSAEEMYNTERPIVIRMATDAYNASKPVVEKKVNETLDWATDKIRANMPKPDATLTPAK